MGNTYFGHLEAKINGKWKCIDGWYKTTPRGKTEEEFRLSCLFQSGSRSYFEETYDELRVIGTMTPFTELSEEVQEAHPGLKYEYNLIPSEEPDRIAKYATVSMQTFRSRVPKNFQYHGVYHKDDVEAYESGETDELWNETEPDFKNMDPLEKQCWTYKEWDNPYGWQKHFKEISRNVDFTVGKYMADAWEFEEPEMRIVAFRL